jgi:hypothetical protein
MVRFAYSSRKAYMSLISVIVAIVVIGFLLWLVETYVPMPVPIKRVLEAVVVLVLVLWLLQAFGLLRGSIRL